MEFIKSVIGDPVMLGVFLATLVLFIVGSTMLVRVVVDMIHDLIMNYRYRGWVETCSTNPAARAEAKAERENTLVGRIVNNRHVRKWRKFPSGKVLYFIVAVSLSGLTATAGMATNHVGDVVARTLYAEARGEGIDGLILVASVIQNRWVADSRRFSHDPTVEEICLKPWAFSCWRGDYSTTLCVPDTTTDEWGLCLEIQKRIKEERFTPDPRIKGARHYTADPENTWWAQGHEESWITIGRHTFVPGID